MKWDPACVMCRIASYPPCPQHGGPTDVADVRGRGPDGQEVNVFRDGRVHVKRAMCATCIFRPGNPMGLRPGRVADMIRGADQDETAITCHSTLYQEGVQNAVCRGYFDRRSSRTLRIATALNLVEEVD